MTIAEIINKFDERFSWLTVLDLLPELTLKESEILKARTINHKTLKDTASLFHVTPERVRQIQEAAEKKLRAKREVVDWLRSILTTFLKEKIAEIEAQKNTIGHPDVQNGILYRQGYNQAISTAAAILRKEITS
jgi:DNA-binding CsgD family transcriptional regulator